MAGPKSLSDRELLNILQAEEKQSVGFYTSEIADAQKDALNYYLGEPFGDEVDGRSQVVSRDVAEVVDWMMPACMRVFLSTDKVVCFKANTFQQELMAATASDMCNHVFLNENDGWRVVHDTLKSGFLQKIGVAKVYWDDAEETEKEEYEGLDDLELTLLREQEDFDLTNSDETEAGYHVQGIRTKPGGQVRVEAIPPEEFLISTAAASLEDAPYTAHKSKRTRSELVQMGFDKKTVYELSEDEADTDDRRQTRFHDEDYNTEQDREQADPAMEKVWVLEEYVRVDFDGDGIAELRQVFRSGNEILSNVEVDDDPWAAYVPIMTPHKFYGQSLADKTMDIQHISSTLLRNGLDSIYLSLNPQKEVPDMAQNEYTLDDILTPRVGGVIRTAQPGLLREIVTPDVSSSAFKGLDYMSRMRQQRTGITETNQGLAADTLSASTVGGTSMHMDAANEQKDFYVRNYAETFLKTVFRKILRLMVRHHTWGKEIQVNGSWQQVNPGAMDPEMYLEVQVGLGTGNKQARIQNAAMLAQLQQQAAQIGMAGPKEFFNTAKELTDAMGLKSTELYFTAPDQVQPPQQPPDPKMVEAQQKAQLEQFKVQSELRLKEAEMAAEQDRKERQLQFEAQLKAASMNADISLKERQFSFESALASAELQVDADIKRQQTSVRFGGEPG